MKRFLLFITLISLAFVQLQAKDGDQLTLQAGSANVFWTLTSAYFETDWSEVTVEGKPWAQWLESKGSDYVRDWPSDKRKIEEYFMNRLNKKTGKKRGIVLQNTNPNDAYYFVIRPQAVDMGSIGGGVVASAFLGSFAKKSGGVNFKTGYMDVVESTTGKVVCRLSFRDIRGNSGLNMSSQLIYVLEDLNDEIIGFANRNKGQNLPEIYVESGAAASQQNTAANVYQSVPTSASVASQSAPTMVDQQQVAVKLKNGATVKGLLKSFDPLEKVVLIIAGKETTIPMEKVENVEMAQMAAPVQTMNHTGSVAQRPTGDQTLMTSSDGINALGNKKIMVTETASYPERITVNIGNTPVEMVLIKGGRMNMGFDGDHSLSMQSEPIHEVGVSSFYMSTKPLSSQVLANFGKTKHDEAGYAIVEKYKDVEAIINAIARATNKPFRITTEAEWEYAACSDLQNLLFADVANREKIAYDWCSDYFDEFRTGSVVIDPTGPMSGNNRVVRAYNNKYGKLNRNNKISVGRYTLGYIRLVIKAKDAGTN